MDIQLADGLSFEIFEKTEVSSPVIFTTAYDEYTIRAFKVNSVDYLLKPVDYEELAAAIEKFRLNFGPKAEKEFKPDVEIYDQLISKFVHTYKNRFVVKVGLHIRSIPVEEIDYFFILEKSTFICTKEGKNYVIDYYLDRLEKLIDPQLFFRITGRHSRMHKNAPSISASITLRNCSGDIRVISIGSHSPPALFTRISILPNFSRVTLIIFDTSTASFVSAFAIIALLPISCIAF